MENDSQIAARKVSQIQIDALLKFLIDHPVLARGKKGKCSPKVNVSYLWEQCAKKLNSIDKSIERDGKGWAKYWHYYKYRLKRRSEEKKSAIELENVAISTYRKVAPITDTEQMLLLLLDQNETDTVKSNVVDSDDEDMRENYNIYFSNEEFLDESDTCKANSKVSQQQLEALIDFLHKHPVLASGTKQNEIESEKLWNKCSKLIKKFDRTSQKDGIGWSKYWQSYKCELKMRLKGPETQFTELEQKAFRLCESNGFEDADKSGNKEDHKSVHFVDVEDDDVEFSDSSVKSDDVADNDIKTSGKRRRPNEGNDYQAHPNKTKDTDLNKIIDNTQQLIQIEKTKIKLMHKNIESLQCLTEQISKLTKVMDGIKDRLPPSKKKR